MTNEQIVLFLFGVASGLGLGVAIAVSVYEFRFKKQWNRMMAELEGGHREGN